MKISKFIIGALAVVAGMSLAACSDSYMEDLNTDPTKVADIDPNAQLTTALLQAYGDLGHMHIYRDYQYAFTQQFMGCWNPTKYGGLHNPDDNEMRRTWDDLYPYAIKNLTDAIYRSTDIEARTNINACCRIMRVYFMSLITDTYGDVPYTEAGKGYIESIDRPIYDTQKEIYYDFFKELTEAVAQFDATKDRITGDLMLGGDINKWKRFANSLRLRYAMRISDIEPEKAKAEFEAALAADGGVIDAASYDALVKHMDVAFSFGDDAFRDFRTNALSELCYGNDPANNPTYICSTLYDQLYNTNDPRAFMICRFYYDLLMDGSSTAGRVDLTDEIFAKGVKVEPCVPGSYSWDRWPTGYYSDIIAALKEANPSVDPNLAREVRPKLANNFLDGENPGVIITSAEVKLLMAEAKVKGWNVNGDAATLYKEGVRAAMDFLSDNYDFAKVSNEEFETYMANGGQFGYTAEKQKEAINTQAWILHLTNPAENWSNVRRSGYPMLKSPADYGFESVLVTGRDIPTRLSYPRLEASYNKANYDAAIARMGSDSWNNLLWWDVKK